MAVQSRFYLPTKPVATGKTYYAAIRNASDISEPLRTAISGGSAGGIWNFTAGNFDAGAAVDCSNVSIWANYVSPLSEENAGQCGGVYTMVLPVELQSPGINLEIMVYEQAGGSPDHSLDSFQTIAAHYTGDEEFRTALSISPSDDENSIRLVATFYQGAQLKDAGTTPNFTIDGPASVIASVTRVAEGVYYQAVDLSSVSTGSFIGAKVSAEMQAGVWHSGTWNDTGVACAEAEDSVYFAKGADVGSAVSAIGNRPVITGS